EIEAEKFFQYLFFRQWLALKNYARKKNVQIIGDIPIFVALDSADVWCNRDKFKFDDKGSPLVVAGVPPDYFSKTGQLWGNPIYDWEAMRADDFSWWTARISFSLMTVDIVRLDHFIGFARNWEVPSGDRTAENGKWVDVPGEALFTVLRRRLGDLAIIAEDLGAMTPEVDELRDAFGFPGMRILQYGFGGDARNRDLPHNYIPNCVAYTGTHDNETAAGWYKATGKNVRAHYRKYFGSSGRDVPLEMIRACLASVANTAIVPFQDLIGLKNDARMNTPGTASGNWEWRLAEDDLNDKLAKRLRDLAETYGRVR
ncbi:MAG: 4-alpha-glucanotransferase, partial [Pyrinomonadaceae bacterium]